MQKPDINRAPAPPAAPSGWRCVPVELTPEMITAGGQALSGWVAPAMHADVAYRAMLAAAPPPPVPAQAESGETKEWRCFQCDEVFTDEAQALAHFGLESYKPSVCCDPAEFRQLQILLARNERYISRLTLAAQAARDALEPFGDVFNEGNEDYPDSEPATIKCGRSTHYATKLGDYHRAAAALASLASVLDGGER